MALLLSKCKLGLGPLSADLAHSSQLIWPISSGVGTSYLLTVPHTLSLALLPKGMACLPVRAGMEVLAHMSVSLRCADTANETSDFVELEALTRACTVAGITAGPQRRVKGSARRDVFL